MPSLSFQSQFIELIQSGNKRQTIRPIRKNPIKAGDKLYLFTGLRTKKCMKLITPYDSQFEYTYNGKKVSFNLDYVICKSVERIRIFESEMKFGKHLHLTINGKRYMIDKIAINDGFSGMVDFIDFFKTKYGLPFEGVLIKW